MLSVTSSSTVSSLVKELVWSLVNLAKLPYQFTENANSFITFFSLSYIWARFDYTILLLKTLFTYNPSYAVPTVSSQITNFAFKCSLWVTGSPLFTSQNTSKSTYSSTELGNVSISTSSSLSLQEGGTDQRFMRSMNPVFKYDFKVGNYMPDDAKKMNPHLFNTIKDVTTGIRKSS
jgi:hypothetical protein